MKKAARNLPAAGQFVHLRRIPIAVFVVATASFASQAEAQVAKVSAAQRIIETRAGNAGGWKQVGSGASLGVNDRLRTGKRSKVDLKFSDGSLLRLGQLSSVEIRGAKNVALTGGQVLFSAIRPGTRIVAGAGAAEIKGSSGLVNLFANGTAEFILFSGLMDVVNEQGERIPVPPGKMVTMSAAGIFSPPQTAPPYAFSSTPQRPDISTPPQSGPYVGSDLDIIVRNEPNRLLNEPATEIISVYNPTITQGNPLIPSRIVAPSGSPFPIPFPEVPTGGGGRLARDSSRQLRASAPTGNATRISQQPVLIPLVTRKLSNSNATTKPVDVMATQASTVVSVEAPAAPPVLIAAAPPVAASAAIPAVADTVAHQTPPALPATPETTQAADAVEDLSALDTLDLSEAYRHLKEAYTQMGEASGGDVNVIGALGDGGLRAYGGRMHAYSASGPWHVDLAAQSIRVRGDNSTFADLDLTAISSAALTYRNHRGDIVLGRQRFQEGPAQATLFGSLVRQGTREIMDAVRVRPNLGKNKRLEVAYLFDAYPRSLPYRIGGRQRGMYGRFAMEGGLGRFGVNVLKYNNLPIANSTGTTVDFSVPIVRNKLELYGEVGRDTFRRRLTTAGLSFPWLYDRTNFDVYLEYANLRSSSIALRPPTELTLRAYRRLSENANLILSASRFYGSGSSFLVGVSFGGSTNSHHDSY